MDERELRTSAREFARYAIINELRRRPFKRDDLMKAGLLELKSRQFDNLLTECNYELSSVFGMELIEMRSRGLNAEKREMDDAIQKQAEKQTQTQNTSKNGNESISRKSKVSAPSTRQYLLRSKLDPSLIDAIAKIVDSEIAEDEEIDDDWYHDDGSIFDWRRGDELGQMGLLGMVLALILVNGRTLEHGQLLIYLKRLNIDPETWTPPHNRASIHPPTSLASLLSIFSKQGYLELTQIGPKGTTTTASQSIGRRQSQLGSGETDSQSEWRWGARAELEYGEKQIAEFITDIYRSVGSGSKQQEGDQRQQPKLSKERLMRDIAKSAGGELMDSGDTKSNARSLQDLNE